MMEHTILAPQLGESIKFLKILEFLKSPGDAINIDEPIVVVETDKASMEIESPVSGIIQDFKVALHDEVPIGQELATIKVMATPLLNRPSSFMNSSLLAASTKQAPQNYTDQRLSTQQSMLVSRMRVVDACLHTICDSEPVQAVRQHYRHTLHHGYKVPSSTELFAWCALKAMRQHPRFRSMLLEDGMMVRQFHDPTIGIAISLPGDELTILSLSDKEHADVLEFSESYKQKLAEVKSGKKNHAGFHSLAISDLSAYDIQTAVPVIIPPAVATLCIGRVHSSSSDRTYALSLSFDHRLINGVGAASFLKSLKSEIQKIKPL